MRKLVVRSRLTLAAILSASAAEIFSTNSGWQVRPGTNKAFTPAATWRAVGFNDASTKFVNATAPF